MLPNLKWGCGPTYWIAYECQPFFSVQHNPKDFSPSQQWLLQSTINQTRHHLWNICFLNWTELWAGDSHAWAWLQKDIWVQIIWISSYLEIILMIASHSAMMLKRQWVRRVRINMSTNVINKRAVPPLTTVSNFTAHLCTDTPRLLLKHFEWFNVFSFKNFYCFNEITLVVHIKVTLQRL